ncbi:RING finger protein 10, partial [Elysia marginata]
MDKRLPARQPPCLARNNGEKKSDYVANKSGRPKKHRDGSNGGRSQDSLQQTPRPQQKYGRGFSDKRPRQRGYLDCRQSEEVTEPLEEEFDYLISRKSKGNANHLLNFSYSSAYSGSRRGGGATWGGSRKSYSRLTPSYKKEQYLQASCQFIVKDSGDYSKQAIDPDALVDWDDVQLVRTFSPQLVCCPICLDVPVAAKMTCCGHIYCWGCILHYLHVNYSPQKDNICPICPEIIEADKLRSVQSITVPDYKVGDTIEMKLMRKSKGSVFVCPEEEWTKNREAHLNMNAGTRTKFSKILLASWQQVKVEVIDVEKEALSRALLTAEPEEVCFLEMAQDLLGKREADLLFGKNTSLDPIEMQKMMQEEESVKEEACAQVAESEDTEANTLLPPHVSFDGSKINIVYNDAFEDEETNSFHMSEGESVSSDCDTFEQISTELSILD